MNPKCFNVLVSAIICAMSLPIVALSQPVLSTIPFVQCIDPYWLDIESDALEEQIKCQSKSSSTAKFEFRSNCGNNAICLEYDSSVSHKFYQFRYGNCNGGILTYRYMDSTYIYYVKHKTNKGKYFSRENVEFFCSDDRLIVFIGAQTFKIYEYPFDGRKSQAYIGNFSTKGYQPPIQLLKTSDSSYKFIDQSKSLNFFKSPK